MTNRYGFVPTGSELYAFINWPMAAQSKLRNWLSKTPRPGKQ